MEEMNKTPLISVIIPIYNVEDYIADCLESVLSQSYQHIEVICVDDCSPDGSINIVERLAQNDARVRILRHACNRGLGAARNTGLDAADGDFVLFLDSDDLLYPDSLKLLFEDAVKTNADIVAGRVVAFPHGDDSKSIEYVENYNRYDQRAPSGIYKVSNEYIPTECRLLSVVSTGRLFRTSFLKLHDLHFIDQKVAHEDNGFYYKYLACFPCISITDIPSIQYRIRANSIIMGLEKKAFEKRRNLHLKMVYDDVRTYLFNKYDENTASDIHCLLDIPKLPTPFIFDYGKLFQLKWSKEEKLIRLLGIPLFKKRRTSTNKFEYSVCSIRICRRAA